MMASEEKLASSSLLRCGASLMVLSAALVLTPVAAMAQDTQATDISSDTETEDDASADETVIVTGQRRALQTSQNIKRNADTIVDSITATDIGAFPDKSVAEALQRVPGITVNRFAATSDTAHFSAEPSGVIVRGLPQVRSEFNGRDTFSANSSRGLSWGDISPELMAGVDTYKNQTAELIEGGIAGSINLRTRVPFDAEGQLIQATFNLNYGDISEEVTPEFSAFYSNRWVTGIGELGIMGNFAYSKVKTASQGIQYGRAAVIDNGFGPTGPDTAYLPSSINFLDNLYNRERQGIAAAAQWRSLDEKVLVTAQYNRSTYENAWEERSFGAYWGPDLWQVDARARLAGNGGYLDERIPLPAPGTPAFTFDEDGNFESGVFNRGNAEGSFWWGQIDGTNLGYGANDQGEPMFDACYNWGGGADCVYSSPGVPVYAPEVGTASRMNQNKNMTQDFGVNLKWEASDRLRFNFDGQFVDATVENYDLSAEYRSFANVGLDASGDLPRITLSAPTNVNQSAGGLANPNNWYVRSVQDHMEDSEGQQYAFRADGEYDADWGWIDSIKFGARYADRDQTVRWSTYNWGNVANTWTDLGTTPHPYWNLDSHAPSGNFRGYPHGLYETSPFGSSFFGGQLGEFQFVPVQALRDGRPNEYSIDNIGVGSESWRPTCARPAEMPDSCYVDNEIAEVSETTKAAYVMVRYSDDESFLGGLPVSGNIGVRFVETENTSHGYLRYPEYDYNPLDDEGQPRCNGEVEIPDGVPAPPVPPIADPAFCYLSAADRTFINGGSEESTASRTHRHWLPSFNMRIDLSDKWLLRFAASRALSRPDIGYMKNFMTVTAQLPNQTDQQDPRWVRDASGTVTGVNPTYRADAFNPYLAPTTAWQVDVSLENYFANVGSFSLALFWKDFDNYIQYGSFERTIERDGVEREVIVRGPANGDGASIKGFEVAYQRFFDFLPEPFSGFGVQANYTYVHNTGVPNANLTPVGNTGQQTNTGTNNTALNPNALEGLSKHAYNLVGMYEKGRVAARLAYNWRSKYLVTAVDCCVYLPVWQEASGFLDGSVRLRVTDNVEVSIQGSNLLNTKTVLKQQVTDEESPEGRKVLTPNGWFQNDRRFVFGARFRF